MASDVEKLAQLSNLIDQYWAIAYEEGQEARAHDTEDAVAMRTRSAIDAIIRELKAALTQPAASGEVAQPDADTVRDALLQIRHSIQQARKPGNDWRRELKLIENITDAAIDSAIKGEK